MFSSLISSRHLSHNFFLSWPFPQSLAAAALGSLIVPHAIFSPFSHDGFIVCHSILSAFSLWCHATSSHGTYLVDCFKYVSPCIVHPNPSQILVATHICANIRYAPRASTRRLGLRLLDACSPYVNDSVRLQRIVPHAVSLLQDDSVMVVVEALRVLANAVRAIVDFTPPAVYSPILFFFLFCFFHPSRLDKLNNFC